MFFVYAGNQACLKILIGRFPRTTAPLVGERLILDGVCLFQIFYIEAAHTETGICARLVLQVVTRELAAIFKASVAEHKCWQMP